MRGSRTVEGSRLPGGRSVSSGSALRGAGAPRVSPREALGQVASQTLRNLAVEENVVSIPILRPLVGLDKTEIIERGRNFDTFDISISSGLCCTIVPEKPSTMARLEKIEEEESKLDVDAMIDSLMDSLQLMKIE